MYFSSLVVAILAFTGCVSNDFRVGTWTIAAQAGRSATGTWEYATNSTGGTGTLCTEADIHALVYEITGTATVFYATAGHRYYQAEYVDGKLHGEWRMWYPDGKLLSTGRLERGDLTGRWTWFVPDGTVRESIDWSDVDAKAPFPPSGGYGGSDGEVNLRYFEDIALHGVPPVALIHDSILTNASITGIWGDHYPDGLNWQRMIIHPTTGATVSVAVDSFIDVGGRHYSSTNRATYAGGVLWLDGLIETSRCRAFRRAYVVDWDGRTLLVPESLLRVFQCIVKEEGEDAGRSWLGRAGLPKIQELEKPQPTPEGDSSIRRATDSGTPQK